MDKEDLANIQSLVFSNIHFVSEELINEKSWLDAFALTKGIDEDDTPFVALSIELNAKLWTGDKTLTEGLAKKGQSIFVTTAELKEIIK